MGTPEIIIVFSALMALIALVTIGIDWLGKPLKNRRFIPRMYRFDDEKLPIDEYGNATFDVPDDQLVAPIAYVAPVAVPQQYPTAPATYFPPVAPMQPDLAPHAAAIATTEVTEATSTTAVRSPSSTPKEQPAPRQVARVEHSVASSQSAFSDSLMSSGQQPVANDDPASLTQWELGMALDTTVNDEKPNLAVKAERFWMSQAVAVTTSHFDADNRDRMANGKAPRRTNPRTGHTETMLLTGLREASQPTEVRMRWPDESVDPWSGQ